MAHPQVVLDNIIFSIQRLGGISLYWSELLKGLLARKVDLQVIENNVSANAFRRRLAIDSSIIRKDARVPVYLSRYLPVARQLPAGSIFHSSYYRTPLGKKVTCVITVYDFIYEYFVHGLPAVVHKTQKGRAIRRAQAIICISRNTRADLLKYYPEVEAKRIAVIPPGVGPEFFPDPGSADSLRALGLKPENRYVLFVGSRGRYKNFSAAVRALKEVKPLCLAIVGGGQLTAVEHGLLEENLRGRYTHLANVTSLELNSLYNAAHCLLYLSLYEGFGIPLVEAMKAGCPVICSNNSSLREVGEGVALLVDDANIEEVSGLLARLFDPDLRAKLIKQGKDNAAQYTWERCVEDTLSLYREML